MTHRHCVQSKGAALLSYWLLAVTTGGEGTKALHPCLNSGRAIPALEFCKGSAQATASPFKFPSVSSERMLTPLFPHSLIGVPYSSLQLTSCIQVSISEPLCKNCLQMVLKIKQKPDKEIIKYLTTSM